MNAWPKNPDGTNKRFGDMTRDEQRAQIKASCERLQKKFDDPRTKAAIKTVMDAAADAIAKAAAKP